MTKEEIEHEKLWVEGIVSAVMLSSKGIVSDFIINLEKVGYKIVKSESENERLIKEVENRVVECILDDIDFGYDLATIKGKIKSGSYVGNSPETFKENERLKAEREWILCDDDMPEVDETVWITNGCGWTALGCLVQCEDGYCWAVTNGIIYEEDGKIVSECELDDDYDVVYWHRLPQPPKQSCPQCKTEYTKEELLTNEHCFKCGFEMKGF